MKSSKKDFTISFSGLKLGKHEFEFSLNRAFFTAFDYEDFADARLVASVSMEKFERKLHFDFVLTGQVKVQCDLSAEWFWLDLNATAELLVKFGPEPSREDDELWILSEEAHFIELDQYLYEMAVLAKPLKLVHPKVASGELDSAALQRLQKLDPTQQEHENNAEETDPRWDKLKDLLN